MARLPRVAHTVDTPANWAFLGCGNLQGVHNVAISAVKSQVVPCPVDHGANLVAAAQDVKQVEPQPGKPRGRTSEAHTFDLDNRLVPTDGGHCAFVAVTEVAKVSPVRCRTNLLANEPSLLHRDRSHHGQRSAILADASDIADSPDVGMSSHLQSRQRVDASSHMRQAKLTDRQ